MSVQNAVSRKLSIHGFFPEALFSDWITTRARRLSLEGWVKTYGSSLIEVHVAGDSVLIEAMEVACSLGPIDAKVDRVESLDVPALAPRHGGQFDGYSSFTSFGPDHIE